MDSMAVFAVIEQLSGCVLVQSVLPEAYDNWNIDAHTTSRGVGAGPAGTAAAGPMLEAKLMNLIKGRCRSSDSAIILA